MFLMHPGTLAVLLAVGALALPPAQGAAGREKPKDKDKGGLALMAGLREKRTAMAAAGEGALGGDDGDARLEDEGEDEEGAEKDDPIGRRKWFGEWFGPITAEHLDYVTAVGEKEIEKWGHLIPGTKKYVKPAALPNGGIPPNVWKSIGPFDGSSLQSTSYNDNIIDSGRPTTIVPHPTNSSILYVGFAGGGLWRSTNATLANTADWVWEPLTDGLPGGGNQSVGAAALDPDDPNKVYLSLGDMMSGSAPIGTAFGRGFYISSDGGATWVRGANPGRCTRTKTVLALGGGRVLVAGNMGLFNSTDGGMTFTRNQSGPLADGSGESYSGQTYLPNQYASAWDIVKLDDGTLVLTYQFTDGGGGYDGTPAFSGYGNYGGGGIAYSTDNGVTWTKATYPARTSSTTYGKNYGRIAICASGNTLYGLFQDGAVPDSGYFPPRTASSTSAGGQLLKSTDGGRNWTIITATGLFNLASDGGQTGYNHLIAVDPLNPDVVFVGSNMALWRSVNGGANFSRFAHWTSSGGQYIHADMHVGVWTPLTQTGNAKALYIATDGGISIVRNPNIATIPTSTTPDRTVIDHVRNRGLATHLVYNIGGTSATSPATGGIQPVRDRVIGGFQDLGTLVRLNNTDRPGLFRYTGVGGDGFGCAYHPYNGNLVLGSLYYTQIRKSTNGGVSGWTNAVSGITGSNNSSVAPFYTRLYVGMADPTGNSVYTFTNTVPYRSSNFADSWTAMTTTAASGWPYNDTTNAVTQIRNMNVSPLRQGLVGVLTDVNDAAVPVAQRRGTIILSSDNGLTWRATLSAFPNNRGYLSDIAFDTRDENIMYVTSVYPSTWNTAGQVGGETYNHMWKSIDGGLTFTPVDGTATESNGFPFGVMVYTAKVDPLDNQVVYAGTELGLYYSQNGGQTWERHGSGLPMVAIYDIYIAPDASFMRVGTHGRGIWEMEGVTASAPVISVHPVSTVVDSGAQASFSVVAVGIPEPTLQWQSSADGSAWDDIPGATSGTYSFTTTDSDNNRQYRAMASNSAGSTPSNPATLTVVIKAPPSFTTSPNSAAVNAGHRVTFTAAADGAPAPTVKWQVSRNGGTSWSDRTYDANYFSSPWITESNPLGFYPAPEDNGLRIRMSATNSSGTVNSPAATLMVDAMNRQMLRNPEFEEYATSASYPGGYPGVGWEWSDRQRMAASAEANGQNDAAGMGAGTTPGRRCAWLGAWEAAKTDWVYQDFVIPSDVEAATLTFRLAVVNFAPAATAAVNRFQALIKDPSNDATLATVLEIDNTSGDATVSPDVSWRAKPSAAGFDLTRWKGRTVRVYFTSSQTAAASNTAFFVDNVYVDVARGEAARYDIDGVMNFDVFDVLKFLSLHGSTATADVALADFNGDGRIDDLDLQLMLGML